MIVLGIDPGYHRVGFGLIKQEGNKPSVIDYGCIETDANLDFPTRLLDIEDKLLQIIDKYQPERIGVEEIFFAKNTKTAIKVAQARGIILLTARKKGLDIVELTPNQIKLACTGHGAADKKQMQDMVKLTLKLDKTPQPDDAADALAIAITASTWSAHLIP